MFRLLLMSVTFHDLGFIFICCLVRGTTYDGSYARHRVSFSSAKMNHRYPNEIEDLVWCTKHELYPTIYLM
ncbi:hypothetical protein CUMW_141140 [Citrus unshiu]|nr:hypothetical protein CUMW_141140 [Citrus unshiu]